MQVYLGKMNVYLGLRVLDINLQVYLGTGVRLDLQVNLGTWHLVVSHLCRLTAET